MDSDKIRLDNLYEDNALTKYCANYQCSETTINILLSAGISPICINKDTQSVLSLYLHTKNPLPSVVSALVSRGAEVDHVCTLDRNMSILSYAAENRCSLEVFNVLLCEVGYNPEKNSMGRDWVQCYFLGYSSNRSRNTHDIPISL